MSPTRDDRWGSRLVCSREYKCAYAELVMLKPVPSCPNALAFLRRLLRVAFWDGSQDSFAGSESYCDCGSHEVWQMYAHNIM